MLLSGDLPSLSSGGGTRSILTRGIICCYRLLYAIHFFPVCGCNFPVVDTHRWQVVEGCDTPSGRSSMVAQVYKNSLYIFGGYNGHNVLNDFYEFKFGASTESSSHHRRRHHFSTLAGGIAARNIIREARGGDSPGAVRVVVKLRMRRAHGCGGPALARRKSLPRIGIRCSYPAELRGGSD